jgi:alginate O-acetyltransferase complex protein AlgJ
MSTQTISHTRLLSTDHGLSCSRASGSTRRKRATATFLLALAFGVAWPSQSHAGDGNAVGAFLSALSAEAASAEKEGRGAIAGADGWLFFVAELRAMTIGPFWGERARGVSRASNPQNADPLPAIVDFNDQLKRAGIELLIVPVPAKAAIYPDAISKRIKAPAERTAARLDPNHERFYRLLGERGVAVLDLTARYIHERDRPGAALYCQTDSHWSARGIELAAQAIAKQVRDRPWMKAMAKTGYTSESQTVEITGDLARMLDEAKPQREKLSVTVVATKNEGQLSPVEPARDSPILLMGDSHTLVFHDPELYARGAGLPDHLALCLGFAVDLVGIRGSAATTTRIELLRRRDNLEGKKLVVWCFSFREFTESTAGWRLVPVIR